MTWGASKIFRLFVSDMITSTMGTGWTGLDSDVCKVALYNNTITPDQDVATATLTAYNGVGSQWVVANEVTDANWPAGGVNLTTPIVAPPGGVPVAGVVFFDGDDTTGAGNVTLTNAYGCLVYDSTVSSTANRGVCFNYFGGAQSVTGGTFTIVWSANGLFRFTL